MTGFHSKQLFQQFMMKYKNSIHHSVQCSPYYPHGNVIVYSQKEVDDINDYIQTNNIPYITNTHKLHENKYHVNFEPFYFKSK